VNGLQIIGGGDLSDTTNGTITSLATIEVGRQQDLLNRDRRERVSVILGLKAWIEVSVFP
jgi:hypothetical protein